MYGVSNYTRLLIRLVGGQTNINYMNTGSGNIRAVTCPTLGLCNDDSDVRYIRTARN